MVRRERTRWRPRFLRKDGNTPELAAESVSQPGPVAETSPAAVIHDWSVVTVPQFRDMTGLGAPVALVSSEFHAARAPSWVGTLHPNRLQALDESPSLLIVDASLGDPISAWSGVGRGELALTDAVIAAIGALRHTGVPTVFRWDTNESSPWHASIADACEYVVSAASSDIGAEPVVSHGIDPRIFSPPTAIAPNTERIIADKPIAADRFVSDALLLDPKRLSEVFRLTRRLIIDRPATPLLRAVAAEAVACGVEVTGIEPIEAVDWTEVASQLSAVTETTITIAAPKALR